MAKTTNSTSKSKKTVKKAADTHADHDHHGHDHDHSHDHSSELDALIADNTKLSLTLPWAEVKAAYDKALTKLAKSVKIQGFRKGKVPTKLAEEKIGRQKLIQEVLDMVVPAKYRELIDSTNKKPLTYPEIVPTKLDWEQDWELEVQIAEKPEITLGKYQSVVKEALKQAEKDLKKKAKEAEKAAKKAKKDAGKTAEAVKEAAAQAGAATDEYQQKLAVVFKALVEDIKPQVPQLLLKERTRDELQRMAQEVEKIGMTLEEFLQKRGQDFETYSAQLAAQMLGHLQLEFVLEAIEEKLDLKVTEKELDEHLSKVGDKQLRAQMKQDERYRKYVEAQLRRDKVLEKLVPKKADKSSKK